MSDVLAFALLPEKVQKAVDLMSMIEPNPGVQLNVN
jgi:hypothetical protein